MALEIKQPTGLGQFSTEGNTGVATNRSGAVLSRYGAYVRDIRRTQGESDAIDTALLNIDIPATGDLSLGAHVVIAQGVDADNAANCKVVEGEGVICRINVNNSAITVGSQLKIANGVTTLCLATVSTDRAHAVALEANSSAAATIWCILYSSGRRA